VSSGPSRPPLRTARCGGSSETAAGAGSSPSPEPHEILELETISSLLDAGSIVDAAGGGGIPVIRRVDGFDGVDAVVDKDLSGALLARRLDADLFVIATDVKGVALRFREPDEEWLGKVSSVQLREHSSHGFFAQGSMAPKVEVALRFVEAGGRTAAIARRTRWCRGGSRGNDCGERGAA
jgi:carbamate kinase